MMHSDLVLVVDDDPDMRDSLCTLLEMEGYRAVGAANGKEALDYLQGASPPCVIILDLMMPVMTGAEFRKRQLADPTLARVPTLVLSAMAASFQKTEVADAAGYLVKPLEPEEFTRTVRQFCEPSGA